MMKKRFYFIPTLFVLSVMFFSCDNPPGMPTGDGGTVTEQPKVEDNTHLRSLAATEVAPNMTTILKEAYNVLIYVLTIEPGDTVPYHDHSYHSYYFIEGGTLEIIFEDLSSVTNEFETGETGMGEPIRDMTINRGETTIKVLMYEFYSLKISGSNSYPPYNKAEAAFNVAPFMTELKHDTLGIVVYELIMKPGETLPYHAHPYHSNYIIEGGTLEVIVGNGSSGTISEYPEGRTGLGKPLDDIAINRGATTIKVLLHEIYSLDP